MKILQLVLAVLLAAPVSACAQQYDPQSSLTPQQREEIRKTARDTAREIKRITSEFKEFYSELRDVVQEEGIADLGLEGLDDPSFGSADVIDEEKQMIVKMDMPGVKKSDVQIRIKDQKTLEIEAVREGASQANAVRDERRKGRFVRTLELPQTAAQGGFKAELADGVLTVKIPKEKPSSSKVQNIPIS